MKFKEEIERADLVDKVTNSQSLDPNINYEFFEDILIKAKQNNLPVKNNKINKRKHKKSPWITSAIVKSINKRDKMYKNLYKSPLESNYYCILKTNFKTYNYILRRTTCIFIAKKQYYSQIFLKYKSDLKQTWATISTILNKNENKHKGFADNINIAGNLTSNMLDIVNHFNNYFINIGQDISRKLSHPKSRSNKYSNYLKIPTKKRLVFEKVTEASVSRIIDSLKPKTSAGPDNISNNLIKIIKQEIVPSLTIIINQSLETGIFPDSLKIAKVVPLFKKDDPTTVNNYRPISLLNSISKIFEKGIHQQLNSYLLKNNLLMEVNMDLDLITQRNLQHLNWSIEYHFFRLI